MKKLLLVCLFACTTAAQAQKFPDMGLNHVRITQSDKMIVTETTADQEEDLYTDRLYYWYSSNVVHSTQGGYSGKLLNGNYSEYFPNKNLKEQGVFQNGLKNGVWKRWYENGMLSELTSWNKGLKQGEFTTYDEQGNLLRTGRYKENQLNGKVLIYHGKDSVETVKYKDGQVAAKTPASPSLWQKVKSLRQKEKDKASDRGLPLAPQQPLKPEKVKNSKNKVVPGVSS